MPRNRIHRTKRGANQPENENLWINNIARRTEWEKRPVNIKKSTYDKYRQTVRRLNAQYEKQKMEMIKGLDPLERDLKIMQLGLGYEITDLSRKVRTEAELQELLERLKKHTVTAANRRYRDNYVTMLENAGFPRPFINKIKKLGGKRFYMLYAKTANAYPKMIYTIYDSESDDEMYRIMEEWEEAFASETR